MNKSKPMGGEGNYGTLIPRDGIRQNIFSVAASQSD